MNLDLDIDPYAGLVERFERALVTQRTVIHVGEYRFRYVPLGDAFFDEDGTLLVDPGLGGVYIRLMYFTVRGVAHEQWVLFGQPDDLAKRMRPYLADLTECELIGLTANFDAAESGRRCLPPAAHASDAAASMLSRMAA